MEKQLNFLWDIFKTSKKKAEPTKKKTVLSREPLHIFVDGASRNNPGPSGAGVYITQGKKNIHKKGYFLGSKTNNQAEYLALTLALFIVDNKFGKKAPPIEIVSDSELLVKQMRGVYRVKNKELGKIKQLAKKLLRNKTYSIGHVLRGENKVADKLANEGIDQKNKLPVQFITLMQDHGIDL